MPTPRRTSVSVLVASIGCAMVSFTAAQDGVLAHGAAKMTVQVSASVPNTTLPAFLLPMMVAPVPQSAPSVGVAASALIQKSKAASGINTFMASFLSLFKMRLLVHPAVGGTVGNRLDHSDNGRAGATNRSHDGIGAIVTTAVADNADTASRS